MVKFPNPHNVEPNLTSRAIHLETGLPWAGNAEIEIDAVAKIIQLLNLTIVLCSIYNHTCHVCLAMNFTKMHVSTLISTGVTSM